MTEFYLKMVLQIILHVWVLAGVLAFIGVGYIFYMELTEWKDIPTGGGGP